jgi:predicted DCC family thiol-disulfide oxidoreductase YuxK
LRLPDVFPLVIYDNECYLCTKFALAVNFLSRGKIRLVGHYTEFGVKLREEILDTSATQMFWLIDGKTAYGGRAALLPLITLIIKSKNLPPIKNIITEESCGPSCKNPKAVFVRSASLFTNSRKIKIN